MTLRRSDVNKRLTKYKELGFKVEWLLKLHGNETGLPSKECGLTGNVSTTVVKELENWGAIRRGKIQKNHTRIWLPGSQYNRWKESAELMIAESK